MRYMRNLKPAVVQDDNFEILINDLDYWEIPDSATDTVYASARESFSEVKSMTEYADEKVARILTVVAFLSILVGVVFSRFASEYTWPGFAGGAQPLTWGFIISTYLTFFLYLILVTVSVIILLDSIMPTFNISATGIGDKSIERPRSMIYYQHILDVDAPRWGSVFRELGVKDGMLLKKVYTKCFVAESYFLAKTVEKKFHRVRRGIRCLLLSMWILLLFFVLFGLTTMIIDPNHLAAT